ncbi:hypothetical protein DY023_13710 [Microbacterium bovistercoris]|uniref:Uncharacterized protein n=1 Tax=Microbacterium bovistercoris TaxID=2293570 RepID=A0A371NQT7_9MICO|nr:hypothetical protein [Microbacterium bovistercoris]REJ04501.1 hypothetical protein DY023_13710 [Microbacterium bovistercoris]
MSALVRTWPAVFAWGCGLLHLGLGASLRAEATGAAGVLAMAALLVLGLGELAWGMASLRAGRPRAPRTAVLGALAGVAVAPAALATGCSAVAVAAALLLALSAVGLASRGKAGSTASTPRRAPGALIAAAAIAAAVVTPALATTDTPSHIGDLPSGGQGVHSGH